MDLVKYTNRWLKLIIARPPLWWQLDKDKLLSKIEPGGHFSVYRTGPEVHRGITYRWLLL